MRGLSGQAIRTIVWALRPLTPALLPRSTGGEGSPGSTNPEVILRASLTLVLILTAASFAGPAFAGADDAPAKMDLSQQIKPLVDAQTMAVAHVRLDKVDVGRLMQLAGKVAELPAGEAAMAELAGKLALASLINAGARDVFLLANLDGFPFDFFCVAFPAASEENVKKIAGALKLALKLATPRRKAPGANGWFRPARISCWSVRKIP